MGVIKKNPTQTKTLYYSICEANIKLCKITICVWKAFYFYFHFWHLQHSVILFLLWDLDYNDVKDIQQKQSRRHNLGWLHDKIPDLNI